MNIYPPLRCVFSQRRGAGSRMHVVVRSTGTPTWICPGDWDQILHLSKATLHQRHSNEVVFYCILSSRGVWVCVPKLCAWEGGKEEAKKGDGKPRNERVERKVCGGPTLYLKDLRMNLWGIMKMFTASPANAEDTPLKFQGSKREIFFFSYIAKAFLSLLTMNF